DFRSVDGEAAHICVVCGDLSDGPHFGAICCRACAAFFRRTVSLKLEYVCRASSNCQIDKCIHFLHKDIVILFLLCFFKYCLSLNILKNKYFINRNSNVLLVQAVSLIYFNLCKEPQITNYDEAKKFCKMESHILTDIINNYFPPFNELPVDDKIIAFKNFYPYFAYAARAFATYETFGKGSEYDDRVLMHEGGYIKISELEKFYENCVKCTAAPKDAARIFLPAQQYLLNVVVAHMRRIKIVEAEFLTLIGMLLWNDCYFICFNSLARVIFLRFQKLTLDMNLNFKMAEIFNFLTADECCKDFILQ
uniref:Nuclear receptor domain-containing protein n=1 Tax=Syphacia muris TaxID=451379 RepID=A0A0N5ADP9_9BILA